MLILCNLIFIVSESVLDGDTGALRKRHLEYVDGARVLLEAETDKDNTTLTQIKTHFCDFVCKLIASFTCKFIVTLLDGFL